MGLEGGIYKTTNAGKTWTKLTKGLPNGDMGRAGLAIDGRKNPATVFAIIDAKRHESGFFRSDDGGDSWSRIGRMMAGGRGGAGGGARAPRRARRERRRATCPTAAVRAPRRDASPDRAWRRGRQR